jgi:hypothetical protein
MKKITVTKFPWGRSIMRTVVVKGDKGLREEYVSEFRGNGYTYAKAALAESGNSPQSLLDRADGALKVIPKDQFWISVRKAAILAGARG